MEKYGMSGMRQSGAPFSLLVVWDMINMGSKGQDIVDVSSADAVHFDKIVKKRSTLERLHDVYIGTHADKSSLSLLKFALQGGATARAGKDREDPSLAWASNETNVKAGEAMCVEAALR